MSARDDSAALLRAAPGLARIGLAAWWRTAEWSVDTSRRATVRVIHAAATGESPGELFAAAGTEVRDQVRRALRIIDPDREAGDGADAERERETRRNGRASASSSEGLRERGAELLRRSADIRFEEDAHPAYGRILDELAPDEGRILRLLALEGRQPAVDVRTARPLGVGSQLVAPGLSMLGAEAGCRSLERVPAYLNNLFRLGLVWFSRDPIEDPLVYQVLEAQPDVIEAMRKAGRGRTVRRSINLTPFGQDFCETCLPLHTAELDALPGAGGNAPHPPPGVPPAPPGEAE
jgi:hypothetical protein